MPAQWSQSPDSAINLRNVRDVQLISDSLGGVFIPCNAPDYHVYCYWFDAEGEAVWDDWVRVDPEARGAIAEYDNICTASGSIVMSYISSWGTEEEQEYWDLRLQKINSEGQLVYPDSGLYFGDTRRTDSQRFSVHVTGIIPDYEGGVIIAWTSAEYDSIYRNIEKGIYAQRISGDGELLWDANGIVAFENADSVVYYEMVASDLSGGMYVSYVREDSTIILQHLNANGERLFGDEGISHRATHRLYSSEMISDNNGGTILGYKGEYTGYRFVELFRFDADGEKVWGEGDAGLVVYEGDFHGDTGPSTHNPQMRWANDSTLFVNWDLHTDITYHPWIQAVTMEGELLWDEPGIPISVADARQWNMRGISSEHSVIYAWHDYRPVEEGEGTIYVQRLSIDGDRLWDEEDILLLRKSGMSVGGMISDMRGGAIVYVGLNRVTSYIQHINREGELGKVLSIKNIVEPNPKESGFIIIYPNPTNGIARINYINQCRILLTNGKRFHILLV